MYRNAKFVLISVCFFLVDDISIKVYNDDSPMVIKISLSIENEWYE